jgi:hypothetical protein
MKTVNLLPAWYLVIQRQRRKFQLQISLLLLLCVLMAAWVYVARLQTAQLIRRRDDVTQRAQLVRNLASDLAKSRITLQKYEDLQSAYKELGNTIPMSCVTQQLLNDLTPGMALSRIVIDVQAEPVKSNTPNDGRRVQKFRNVAQITVMGVAPNDVLIAQFIGKLSANILFSDVALSYSRTEILRDCMVRRFEIQLRMDLDRLGNRPDDPQTAQAGGSNHAG